MSARSPLRHALAAALLLGAAACADQPTTPATPGAAELRRTTGDGAAALSKPVLHPNRTRYRYQGERPATGRSGSASLSMHALLGRDGTTEVELSTGRLDEPWWSGAGTIDGVQVKASSPDGKHLFTHTRNDLAGGGRTSLPFHGLARGAVLDVQGRVKDIDPNRTDVVAVSGTVLRRPNLAVAGVSAPSRAGVGTWVNVSAVIRETNGDVGNWGSCLLYADGVQVDWAFGVWVDAGDAVSCAFTHRLGHAGPVRLEVRVVASGGALRDDDPEDDAAEAVVEGVVTNEMFYSAWVNDVTIHDAATFRSRLRTSTGGSEWDWEQVHDIRYQEVVLYGWIPRPIASPLRIEVSEMTGGATISATHDLWGALNGYTEEGCSSAWVAATALHVYACSFTWPYEYGAFGYHRYAGSVVYHAYEYSRTWDGATGQEYSYTVNTVSSSGLNPIPPLGDDFAMRVRLHDGIDVFTADPVFPLTVTTDDRQSPYQCQPFDDPWAGYGEFCSSSTFSTRTVSGSTFE